MSLEAEKKMYTLICCNLSISLSLSFSLFMYIYISCVQHGTVYTCAHILINLPFKRHVFFIFTFVNLAHNHNLNQIAPQFIL